MAQTDGDLRDKSIPELVKQLSNETSTLLRQEIELAKAEVTQKGEQLKQVAQQAGPMLRRDVDQAKGELSSKGKQAAVGAGLVVGGALFGLMALGVLAAAAIAALGLVLPVWLSALIVAGACLLIAALLALGGMSSLQRALPPVPQDALNSLKRDVEQLKRHVQDALPPKPQQTIETVKEDVEVVKERVRSGKT